MLNNKSDNQNQTGEDDSVLTESFLPYEFGALRAHHLSTIIELQMLTMRMYGKDLWDVTSEQLYDGLYSIVSNTYKKISEGSIGYRIDLMGLASVLPFVNNQIAKSLAQTISVNLANLMLNADQFIVGSIIDEICLSCKIGSHCRQDLVGHRLEGSSDGMVTAMILKIIKTAREYADFSVSVKTYQEIPIAVRMPHELMKDVIKRMAILLNETILDKKKGSEDLSSFIEYALTSGSIIHSSVDDLLTALRLTNINSKEA